MFLYMNQNYNDYHHRKTTCTFLKQKNRWTFLYTKSLILFKKLDNSRYVFIYKKRYTLRYGVFHEIFEVGIYIQKAWHFALRDVFIYKKLDTSQKARQLSGTLRYAIFYWIFEIGVGGGNIFICKKQCTLRYGTTVRMKFLTIISGQLHLLHEFKSDFCSFFSIDQFND